MSNLDEVNMTPLRTEVIKPGGAVESVNGQTGAVVLTAEDVGAAGTEELAGEASARESADSALQESIVSEAATRAGEDGQLQGQITAEVNNRQQGDEDLQAQIDALQGGGVKMLKAGATVQGIDLEDGVYLVDNSAQVAAIIATSSENLQVLPSGIISVYASGYRRITVCGRCRYQNVDLVAFAGGIDKTSTGRVYFTNVSTIKMPNGVSPVNTLTSSLTDTPLAAAQGKALKDLYDALEARVAALEGNE